MDVHKKPIIQWPRLQEDDGEPFEDKMARLTAALKEQFTEGASLESEIRKNLARLGYEL
jgi:type I restriction enzyme M protein